MKTSTIEIYDELIDDITEEIMTHSNESSYLGNMPSSGPWATFQGLWLSAVSQAEKARQ